MPLTGGQLLVAQLQREGVRHVFGIPGVQLDWAVEALREAREAIDFIVPRHEQTASYMADGYARTTGLEGVSMVVPGPGVLNALSGLATAYATSSRTLFIAGQIPSSTIGRGYGMLHEIPDQSGILKSLTKWHGIARSPGDIPTLVNEACAQLRSGQPRPVALELPPDVLQQTAEAAVLDRAPVARLAPDPTQLKEAASLLRGARFPVIQAGGGAAAADAGTALLELAERLQAPIVLTEGARGVLPSRHPLVLTGLGGRAVFPHADVVLAIGTRFLDAVAKPSYANPRCQFIYVNLDPRHSAAPRQAGVAVHADARSTAEALARVLSGAPARRSPAEDMARVKEWCDVQMRRIRPQTDYIDALRSALPDDAIIVSELTQVGYFANVAFPVQQPRSFITPGYQGTLGYGFPTSLGAAVGNPQRRVISLNGDGGFGWGMQELATAARYRLNLTAVVFADGRFGNVQRIQRRTFGQEFVTEVVNPDFRALAAAFGVSFKRVTDPGALGETIAGTAHGGPTLIEVPVGEMASPWPIIHPFVPSPTPPPPNPLGPGDTGGAG
ncbi:MAG TPA: thiamine pyrophosphate-dependent enzyme [Steroidobacteraceae bacterium]|nr:thiamine pyrophosphate-dependent enzyme [Steroidobacteraceae bacterium]